MKNKHGWLSEKLSSIRDNLRFAESFRAFDPRSGQGAGLIFGRMVSSKIVPVCLLVLMGWCNALATDLTVAYSQSSAQACIISFRNGQMVGNNLVGTLQIENISSTWAYIERDPSSTVSLPYTIYLLGPGGVKTFPQFSFPGGKYLKLNVTTPLGLDYTTISEKLNTLEGAFMVDLATRGLLTFALPPDAFDAPPSVEGVIEPLIDNLASSVNGGEHLFIAIRSKDFADVCSALVEIAGDSKHLESALSAILNRYLTADQVHSGFGFISDMLNLPAKISLLGDLTGPTFVAPPNSWARLDVIAKTQAPTITGVLPNSLTTLPLPQTQTLTIHGTGLSSSSHLVFTVGNLTYASRADRLSCPDANTLIYSIAVGSAVGPWTVSLADGTGSASFQVVGTPTSTYSITPYHGPNGSISPSTPVTKVGGESQTFIATPQDSSYCVDQWYLDDTPVPNTGNRFTLANIQASHVVVASFKVAAPPAKVILPSPSPGATGQPVLPQLSWANGGRAISYNVYLNNVLQGNQLSTTFSPATLANSKLYTWRIDAVNSAGIIQGDSWTFTTVAAPTQLPSKAITPSPGPSATGQPVMAQLSWANGGGASSYNIYINGIFQINQSGTTYNPGTLNYSTTYSWRIDAVNSLGTTPGDIWLFSTATASSATYYSLTVKAETGGNVVGGGYYTLNQAVAISAAPTAGWTFNQWQDGDTQNPRILLVSGNATYTASFRQNQQVSSLVVTTLAGSARQSGSIDGAGSSARFNQITGVAVDNAGIIYIADAANNTIRKATPAGVVSTLAGSAGNAGSADGLGSLARFNSPESVAVDISGNVYVADNGNHTVRKVNPAGVVTTLAGSAGQVGSTDGTGSEARFNKPHGVAVDVSGNIYVADWGNCTVRKVTPDGVVTTLAGSAGNSGCVDGTGSAARFYYPDSVAVDIAGNLYVVDYGSHTLRKVTATGAVTTLAGSAGQIGNADGAGNTARFDYPWGVAVDGTGNVYVADMMNNTIRQITAAGVVATIAGSPGIIGSTDGSGSEARFYYPIGVAVDCVGNLYVADLNNYTVRKISSAIPVSAILTVQPNPANEGTTSGSGSYMPFQSVQLTANAKASWAFTQWQDGNTQCVRSVTAVTNQTYTAYFSPNWKALLEVVTTLAGKAGNCGSSDGTSSVARFWLPEGVAVDSTGNTYVTDMHNNTIRKISPAGVVSTFAGAVGQSGSIDGIGSAARFGNPFGIAVDKADNLYITDSSLGVIRKVTAAGAVTTLAGQTVGFADGTGIAARFNGPQGIAVDSAANVYVADSMNCLIRKITPLGVVTTLAGSAGNPGSADGSGVAAQFNYPNGIAVDSIGNIYVADTYNYTIRKVTPDGVVTTLAGSVGNPGSLDGTGSAARFHAPQGLAVDSGGNIFVIDNATIRLVTPTGIVVTIMGLAGIIGSADGIGSAAQFHSLEGLAFDSNGNMYVADALNYTIRKITPSAGTPVVISVLSSPLASGSVSGGGTFPSSDNVSLCAMAATNWLFRMWNDGSVINPRIITVPSSNVTYTANFAPAVNMYVGANTNIGGVVTGNGAYPVGGNDILTATAAIGWRFIRWNDGATNNPHAILVTSSGATYTAIFCPTAIIAAQASPVAAGSVTGGGNYVVGSNAVLSATASNLWRFINWDDTVTNNPRTVVVPAGGGAYTANFAPLSAVTALASPSSGGTVTGGGQYLVGSNATIQATPASGWLFQNWNGSVTNNPWTFSVTAGVTVCTAQFARSSTVSLLAAPAYGGSVAGGGSYLSGSNVTLNATPAPGWLFASWNDGNTSANRTLSVPTTNVTCTATFVRGLGAALEASNLTWTAGGSAGWNVQTSPTYTHGTAACLQNGTVAAGQQSWFQTTLSNCPGSLQFWWNASSAANVGLLQFYTNDVLVSQMSGLSGWNQWIGFIGTTNPMTLKWQYQKVGATVGGFDVGWVGPVTWMPCAYATNMPQVFYQDPTGMLASWVLNSTGGLQIARTLANTGGYVLKTTGDVDGDGVSDLLFETSGGATLLWFMNADGSVRSARALLSMPGYEIKACGDYEGTGQAQLFVQNTAAAGNVYYFRLDAAGSNLSAVSLGAMGGWKLRACGDLDGDGKAELIWQDAGGNMSIWYHNANGTIRATPVVNMGTWAVYGLVDIDGDGTPDLLWQNPGGTTAAWFMNANTTNGSARAGSAAWNTGGWKLKAAGR